MKITAKMIVLSEIKTIKVISKIIIFALLLSIICYFCFRNLQWILTFAILFILLSYLFIKYKKFSKILYSPLIDELQLFVDNLIFYSEGDYIVSEIGIIDLKSFDTIKYSDINKIYKTTTNELKSIKKYIIIILHNKKKYKFLISTSATSSPLYDFSNIIINKNPNVIVD